MAAMTSMQLSRLNKILNERESYLQLDVRREVSKREDYSQVAGEAPDSGDQATAALLTDLNHAEISRDIDELDNIATTRERLKSDDFGFCESCGKAIPFERLEVQPTATRCAPCQSLLEKTYMVDGRGPSL